MLKSCKPMLDTRGVLLIAFVLHVLAVGVMSQGMANKCFQTSLPGDILKLAGNLKILYRVTFEPNKITCLHTKGHNDGTNGDLAFQFKNGPNFVEKRGRLGVNNEGRLIYKSLGKVDPVYVQVRPNQVVIIHICVGPKFEQVILVGFKDGANLARQAEEEVKKIVYIRPNQYRVTHNDCKRTPPPPKTGGTSPAKPEAKALPAGAKPKPAGRPKPPHVIRTVSKEEKSSK